MTETTGSATSEGRLVIGTKRYSSWSLRGWLAVHLARLEVEEVLIPLAGGSTAAIKDATPTGLVPYLEHRGARVWESLSILEYCAEHEPALWPADPVERAHARSVAAEMHAGFRALRIAMPMNLGRDDFAGRGRTPESLADIARIEALWDECLRRYGGPFLFGENFGAADAMFAPVVARFLTYKPELTERSTAYALAVRMHPLMERWYAEAGAEPREWLLDRYENQ